MSRATVEADGVIAKSSPRENNPRWQLVQRIVSTPDFLRSPQLTKFLLYVANATLEQQTQELSEHHIGVEVFGRQPDYDSAADTIVRSHALRLRRKLEQYFQRSGQNEPMRLVIPRGSYVPVFLNSEDEASESVLENESDEATSILATSQVFPIAAEQHLSWPPQPEPQHGVIAGLKSTIWRYRLLTSLLLLCMIALGALFTVHLRTHFAQARRHLLWGQLFTENQPTRVVLGDSGLVLFHAVTRQYVSLHDYLNNDYEKQMQHVEHVDPAFAESLRRRRYTSFVDAMTIARLMRLPEASPERTLVQYSRDMHIEDFDTANLIMIGAQEAVPWVELFEKHMDFVFRTDNPDGKASFRNQHGHTGELDNYLLATGKVFGLIAFLPNLSASGNALIVEGLNTLGTEAAINFVTDDGRILPVLKSLRRPDGSLPHFEILVESDAMGEGAGPARVVAIHVHD